MVRMISGGVCAPKGFRASGIHCGIRKNKSKKDLALVVADVPCVAAAVYTTNLVKGAPLYVTKAHLADGRAQAIICNSGNANTCNRDGEAAAERMCELVSQATGIKKEDVIVASTGVIGLPLDTTPIEKGMEKLCGELSYNGGEAASEAIMTTDTIKKEVAFSFEAGGVKCVIGGMAKGSGMIHPNMATMLVFITTDAAITREMLEKAVSANVKDSFNMISVDGDTSTNDMLSVMSSGLAGNEPISAEGKDFDAFTDALARVTDRLCRLIAKDGEGATRLIECVVTGADTHEDAAKAAKSVVGSSLVKAAMFGSDANWGRVLCALGYSGANLDVSKVGVKFISRAGEIEVCSGGVGVPFSEELAKTILLEDEITIAVTVGDGAHSAKARGCDLTYDYVKINGDYRS